MRYLRRQILEVAALLVFGAVLANGQIAKNEVPKANDVRTPAKSFSELDDLIHYGDLIEVDVVGSTEFDWRGEVTPEGTLGGLKFTERPLVALCRRGIDVAREVQRSYSKFLSEPIINVQILDRSKRPLAILLGAVRNPQRFSLLRDVTLAELIVISGGFSENTDDGIEIRRQPSAACVGLPGARDNKTVDDSSAVSAASETEFLAVRISDLLSGKPGSNVLIFYGDLISVRSAPPVYVIGNIIRPGTVSMTKGLTVGRAIAASGGIPEGAKESKIRIFRRNSGRTETIEVPYDNEKAVSEQAFAVREYDIIEVFGGKRNRLKYPPVLQDSLEEYTKVDQLPIRIIN